MTRQSPGIDTNALGERGESILNTILMTFHDATPLFKPVFLGGKWAIADFAIELVGRPGAFFLIQAKSTINGTNTKGRLKIAVPKDKYNALASTPIPSYVVGINDPDETAFICAAMNPRRAKLSSLCTLYPLRNAEVRQRLFNEVNAFWSSVNENAFWTVTEFGDR